MTYYDRVLTFNEYGKPQSKYMKIEKIQVINIPVPVTINYQEEPQNVQEELMVNDQEEPENDQEEPVNHEETPIKNKVDFIDLTNEYTPPSSIITQKVQHNSQPVVRSWRPPTNQELNDPTKWRIIEE
jgi:hypothetical protein